MQNSCPIGIFDSGYGGLTIFRSIEHLMPEYDYIYLGDNLRAPYGNRSFETVYEYTWQCVQWFFSKGCQLVILACNTASARALRNIQQINLPVTAPGKRVLGVIRPTAEVIGNYSASGTIGVLGTRGTINSGSYPIEIHKFFPGLKVYQQACPMWVPLVENGEHNHPGADYFIKKYLDELLRQAPALDTILLACTHYPLLADKINHYLQHKIQVVAQGEIVARSLEAYLDRHTEMRVNLTCNKSRQFYTTGDTPDFDAHASAFFGRQVLSSHIIL